MEWFFLNPNCLLCSKPCDTKKLYSLEKIISSKRNTTRDLSWQLHCCLGATTEYLDVGPAYTTGSIARSVLQPQEGKLSRQVSQSLELVEEGGVLAPEQTDEGVSDHIQYFGLIMYHIEVEKSHFHFKTVFSFSCVYLNLEKGGFYGFLL